MARARSVAPPLPRAIAPPALRGPGRGGAGRARLRLRPPPRLRAAARERRPRRGPAPPGTGARRPAAGVEPSAAGFRARRGAGRRPPVVLQFALYSLILRRHCSGPAGLGKDP